MKPSITLLFTLLFTLCLGIQSNAEVSCYGDYVAPVAVCDAHIVVSLSNNGTAKLFATDIDDGSHDNCGIVEYKARRMNPGWCPPGVADDTQFRPYVEFCCEDIGQPIWVVLRVVDAHGNYNECMAEVYVQDNTSPDIVCPPNITVSCCFWFSDDALYNPNNHTFGTIVGNNGWAQQIIINDPCNSWYNQPHSWGWDGTAGGNCGGGGGNIWVSIPEVIDYRNSCGVGIIKRKFFVEAGYWSDWCYQTITVKDFSNNHYSVQWPWDYTADACLYSEHDVDPDYLPSPYNKPTIPGYDGYGNSCSLIGVAHEDLVFTFSDGACKKILREWTVIDWCVYQPNNPWSKGIWKHTQVIKLMNSNPPHFVYPCPDHIEVPGYEAYCQGRYNESPHVIDDCTPTEGLKWDYKIDLHDNGSYDLWYDGHGQPYVDKVLPFGWHKILWNIGDACGNYSTCSYKIHVVDKKAPSPVCYYGLSSVVMPLGGMVTIWAKDFNASSYDNCTPAHKLKYSFSSNPWEASRTFTCDDLGTVPIQIWVHDEYGNKDYCTTFIKINDNSTFCESMNEVQGLVTTFNEIPVPHAEASLFKIMPDLSLEDDLSEDKSNTLGQFSLGFGTTQYNRMVMLSRTGKALEGMSTEDLIALQRHINGTQPLTHPHQLYAADLDGNGHVGANDLLLLRNALMGAYQLPGYKGNLSWVFFGDPCDPESMEDLVNNQCHSGVEISHTGTFPATARFRAIKMGDVNADMINTAWHISTRSASGIEVQVRENETSGQFEFIIPEDATIYGLQMSFDAPDLRFSEGVVSLSASNVATDKNKVTRLSWMNPYGLQVRKGDVLFTMESTGSGHSPVDLLLTDEEALFPEMYGSEESNIRIQLVPFKQSSGLGTYETRVTPNPFIETAILEVRIPAGEEFTVTLYDLKGRELSTRKYNSYNDVAEIPIGTNELPGPGIYYYRVKSGFGELSGKFVRQ